MNPLILIFMTMIVCTAVIAAPLPQPLLKIGGGCPSNYATSGGSYCKPNNNARFALVKLGGSCPSGYSTSGSNYCLASVDNAKTAIPKQGGSCPSGYSTSGSTYCLSNQ